MISQKRIAIFGVGSIGRELAWQFAPRNKLFLVDNDETRCFCLTEELKLDGYNVRGRVGDIRDYQFLEKVFCDFIPDYVFNCAARKHVSPMQDTPMEAVTTNINGTWNLIELCKQARAKLVNTSTDKVVNAQSVMGATKRVAEIMVKNAGFVSVRFGNVLGSQGSVLGSIWPTQIAKNQPLTVTDKRAERYMMTIPEAVALMIEAATVGKAGEILILDPGEPVNIYQLALEILKKAGKGNLGVKLIGLRPGEQLKEQLMTEAERASAIKRGKFYVLK